MKVLLRRTTLMPSDIYHLKMEGIVDERLMRSEDGVIKDGVELLTRSLINLGPIVNIDLIQFKDNLKNASYFEKTSIGYLAYDTNYIYQLNTDNEPVAKIDIDIFTALKLKAVKQHNPKPKSSDNPMLLSRLEDYALIKMGYRLDNVPYSFTHGGRDYYKAGSYVIGKSQNFNEDIKLVPRLYGKNVTPSAEVISQIKEHNAYVLFSEKPYIFWNDILMELQQLTVSNSISDI